MTKAVFYVGACVILALSLTHPAPAAAQGYERPPVLSPGQLLPPDLIHSPTHTIVGRVPIEGFLAVYQMQTPWGTFPVKGTDLLKVRIKEAAATAQIAQIDAGQSLVTSAGKTALKPLNTAKDLITAPGQTIGDSVKGVGNFFGRVDASMSATDPNREGTIASLAGGSKARRKLAYDFGVDPYTTFDPLSAELKRVASATAVGEIATNVGLAFVTGGAGIAISVGGTSKDLRYALLDKTAAELEKSEHAQLAAMGISEGAIGAFFANPWLTPTDKAAIVEAMVKLGDAQGREIFIARTAQATTYSEGFAYRRKAELTAAYHLRVSPVRSFSSVSGTPVMQTGHGMVVIVPMDYLYWSPQVEQLLAGAGPSGEVWITGTATSLATSKLASRGWKVVPKAGAKLGG